MIDGTTSVDGTPLNQLTKGSEKLVNLICDSCGKHSTTTYGNYNQYQTKTNRQGQTFCQKCAASQSGRKRKGIPNPTTVQTNQQKRGSTHPSWRGGRYLSHDGYVMIHIRSGHSNVGWDSYEREHIYLMEQHLGRSLSKSEVVHHIDGDKTNNNMNNLWLCDQSQHREAHASLQYLGYELIQAGLVTFDPETGAYQAHNKLRELLGSPVEGNQQPSIVGIQ